MIPLKLNKVTRYFDVRKLTKEEYKDQNILNIELMVEAPPWDLLSMSLVNKNKVCLTTGDGLSDLTLQQGDNYV